LQAISTGSDASTAAGRGVDEFLETRRKYLIYR